MGTIKLKMSVNITSNGFQMTNSVRILKPITLLSEQEIRVMLQNLFRKNGQGKYRLLDLPE